VRAIQGSLGPGTREQQTISLAGANLAYASGALTVGDLTLNSGTLGTGATATDLVTGFASDANYANALFTLADNGSNGLAISWKSTGEITGTAQLQLTATAQTVTASRSVTGVSAADQPAVSEEQFISIADSDLSRAVSVMLNDGSGAQNSYGLGFSGGTTLSDLAAAINASYSSSMPFSVTAQSDGLRLLWSGGGNQSGLASLAVSSPDVTQTTYATSIYSASEVSSGAVAGTTEVQKLALSADDVRGKTLTLSANGVTLSSGAMSATATMADLVAALQSDTNYSNAGLEITEDTTNGVTSGLTLSWTSATAVSDFASMSVIDSLASSTFEATETTAGIHTSVADGTREVQQISVRASAVAGRNVMLRAGNYTLFSGTLDSAASINQLADALKASPRYSAAPFTVSQDRPGYLTLTWKTPGTVSQLAALEVQPDAPLQSLLRRGGVGSAEAATSMSDAIDLAMQTMTSSSDILSFAGLQLTAAVQKLSSRQSSSGPITQHPGTAYVNAISSMLRSQISGNTSQATAAQANFTPQGVITTLQF
jgi:hypothetical protein